MNNKLERVQTLKQKTSEMQSEISKLERELQNEIADSIVWVYDPKFFAKTGKHLVPCEYRQHHRDAWQRGYIFGFSTGTDSNWKVNYRAAEGRRPAHHKWARHIRLKKKDYLKMLSVFVSEQARCGNLHLTSRNNKESIQ